MESSEPFVIAIDGPAGVGKSTTARAVAAALGLGYLDSGALYRCIALTALQAGVALDDGENLAMIAKSLDVRFGEGGSQIWSSGRDVTAAIRAPEVSQAASRISAIAAVRNALVGLQRQAVQGSGTVAEGRDMGTVIFPRAQLKVFLNADMDERARRRAADLGVADSQGPAAAVRAQIAERDARDTARTVAPLRPAPDAVVIDTTRLGLGEVVNRIVTEARVRGIGK